MSVTGRTGGGIAPLLVLLDTAYNKTSWHGPNLRGSLRGVSLEAGQIQLLKKLHSRRSAGR